MPRVRLRCGDNTHVGVVFLKLTCKGVLVLYTLYTVVINVFKLITLNTSV